MKTNNHLEIVSKLKRDGFAVIEDFFDIDFCKTAKNDIDKMISESPEKSFSEEVENTGGDIRFFKFEKYRISIMDYHISNTCRKMMIICC